ncbi:carboxypeptidase Y inhibitor [Oleoguttula sp. CCFEE 5521]
MRFTECSLLATVFSVVVSATQIQTEQRPLNGDHGKADLIDILTKVGIIPDVLDSFIPKLTLSVFWETATAEVGNLVPVSDVQNPPDVQFIDFTTGLSMVTRKHSQLTLALTDPDAPSRNDPKWSQVCHWLGTNIQLTHLDSAGSMGFSKDVVDIMPYKPPGPPPRTGRHRYVFVALAPKNGTTKTLHLMRPSGRRHWGYEGERTGVREWAEEMGLEVVGEFAVVENRARAEKES